MSIIDFLIACLVTPLEFFYSADENSFISVETLKKIDDKKRLELTLKAGELIAIRENIFDEKEHSKYYQIFEDNHKQVAIYFTEELKKETSELFLTISVKFSFFSESQVAISKSFMLLSFK